MWKIPNNVGFSSNFSTGKIDQSTPVDPNDYGKTMIDKNGLKYVQTKDGKIYETIPQSKINN